MSLLLLLLVLAHAPGVGATHINNLDYGAALDVVPVAVVGGVLNIVSINLNRKPHLLQQVDSMMAKKNWHIVLLQETGLITKDGRTQHQDIRRCLCNAITFNSPSEAYLRAKGTRKAVRMLDAKKANGSITEAQHEVQVGMLAKALVR
jgi:hypothetical protein